MVVLPDPEGPISVTRSPRSTVKFKLLRIVLSPKRLSTSRNSITRLVLGYSVGVGESFLQLIDDNGSHVAGYYKDQPRDSCRFDVPVDKTTTLQGRGDHFHHRDCDEKWRIFEH